MLMAAICQAEPRAHRAVGGQALEKLDVEIEILRVAAEEFAVTSLVAPADASIDGFEYRFRGEQGPSILC